jgi:hypothetical protein
MRTNQTESQQAAEPARQLMRHVYGGTAGIMAVFSGHRAGDRLAATDTRYFTYPAELDEAVRHALDESGRGREAYFCAHLLTEARRIKENAAPVETLWGDLDGCGLPNGSLTPTAVVQSSPGNYHAYWKLKRPIPAAEAERLNKRLARKIGADPSGFDLTQLLRLPGTRNHKHEGAPAVELVELREESHEPDALDELLPEPEPEKSGRAPDRLRAASSPGMPDAEVIRRAESAADGPKFRHVYAGGLDYHPGESERDASLAWLTAFWTQDPEQIERIMRGSGCVRPKWDTRRGPTTWLGREIDRAIDRRTETYAGSATLSTNGSANGAGRTRENAPGVTNTSNTSNTFPRSIRMDAAPTVFPVDALPKSAAQYVKEAAASLSCPPELVALPVLAAMSGVMGQSRRLRIKPGWTESGLLWAAVVDPPGGRKSPAAGFAFKPVEKLQAMLRKAHKAERETYAKETRQHALDKKLAARDDKPEPEPPVAPTMGRVIVDDITAEAVAMRLEENPRGLLQAQDELTGFLRGLDQYKSGGKGNARQLYLKIWSGRAIIVDRKGSDEPLAVPQPYVTLQGGIQPAVLHEIAGGRDDGFLDRFLFGYPDPHQGGYSDESISYAAESAYENLIGSLWDLQPEKTEDDEVRPRMVRMTPEAHEMFKAAANSLEAERFGPGFPEILRGPWSKFDTHLARLALIIGVARSAVEGSAVEMVTAEDMRAALRLVDYFKATTRKVYGQLFEANPDDVLAADLVTLLTGSAYKFFGTTSQLLDLLHPEIRPETPDALGRAVRRIAKKSPALSVEPHHDGKERKILITLEKVLEVLEVLGENGHAPPTETDSPDSPNHPSVEGGDTDTDGSETWY